MPLDRAINGTAKFIESLRDQLESIAYGVINLDYVPSEYGKQRHMMRVVKMRSVNFQSGSHDFNIETGGIRLGEPLTDFHGVLTGVPVYHGKGEGLMEKNDDADRGE